MVYEEKEIRDRLYAGVVEVVFKKKNGEYRTMPCTLKSDLLPPMVPNEGDEGSSRPQIEGLIAVYSVEDCGWRSFYAESVRSMNEYVAPTTD